MSGHPIGIKRVYDAPEKADGVRILVDRLWPRGLSKEAVRADQWLRDIGPSDELRKWFGHAPERWDEFKRRYFGELAEKEEQVALIRDLSLRERITFVFAAKDAQHNNAVALREFVEQSCSSDREDASS